MANERRLSSQGREGLPGSLRDAESPIRAFDDARDPSLKRQRQNIEKTEIQRRDAIGGGSQMVKMDKPFPELKPRNDNAVIQKSFNEHWNAEIERAQREHPKAQTQAQARKPDVFDAIDKRHSERGERDALENNQRTFPERDLGR